jgi:hypothetical protein
MEKTDVIAAVCHALSEGSSDLAVSVLKEHYPFTPKAITKRRYSPLESTRVFVRDGFIDRYSGEPLIFPPVFRVLSVALPTEFPYHPNWKTDVTHPAYWEIGASVDHLMPVTRGGQDDESNWITTSMAHNYVKMNWTLGELGWKLHPAGDVSMWDGLIHWFFEYTGWHSETLVNSSVRQWHKAAKLALTNVALPVLPKLST